MCVGYTSYRTYAPESMIGRGFDHETQAASTTYSSSTTYGVYSKQYNCRSTAFLLFFFGIFFSLWFPTYRPTNRPRRKLKKWLVHRMENRKGQPTPGFPVQKLIFMPCLPIATSDTRRAWATFCVCCHWSPWDRTETERLIKPSARTGVEVVQWECAWIWAGGVAAGGLRNTRKRR